MEITLCFGEILRSPNKNETPVLSKVVLFFDDSVRIGREVSLAREGAGSSLGGWMVSLAL